MTPFTRKIVFAITFETLGIVMASSFLMLAAATPAAQGLILSAINASVALAWNLIFNAAFEAWEARQAVKGRPIALRALHALLFEGGLTLIMVPFMACWLHITLWHAFVLEAGLIVLFLIYTYSFTWVFDRIFGLPLSAR